MKRALCSAILLLGLCDPARADEPAAAAVEAAFGRLPASLLEPAPAEIAHFADARAIAALLSEGAEPSAEAMSRVGASALRLRPVEALVMGGAAAWGERTGLAFDEVRAFAGFYKEPHFVSVWRLGGPEEAEALLGELEQQDFSPFDGEGLEGAVANGKPGGMDITRRDPASPWRGRMGRTSVVAPLGDAIVQSADPAAVALVQAAAGGPSLAEHPAVQVALGGLSAGAAEGRIVQATLFSPAVGLPAGDPVVLLGKGPDLEVVRKAVEADLAKLPPGVPPYAVALLADVQSEAGAGSPSALLISLAYADCASAERAGERLPGLWEAAGRAEQAPAEIEVETVEVGAEGCAAVATVANRDGGGGNAAYVAASKAVVGGGFEPLRIGGAEP